MQKNENIFPSISFKSFCNLLMPYWKSQEKWKALLLLSVSIILVFTLVGTNVYLSNWNKDFFDAIQNYKKDIIIKSLIILIIIFSSLAFFSSYQRYIFSIMQIRWRKWMTRFFLVKWFSGNSFYQMETFSNSLIDNPDQRISADIDTFVNLSSSLFLNLLKSLLTFFSFAFILWNLSAPITVPLWSKYSIAIHGYLFWCSVLFTLITTWITVKIGKPLIKLSFFQEKYEANFRYNLIKNRENSEQISMYNAEKFELNGHESRFEHVYENFIKIAKRNKLINIFSILTNNISSLFPLIIALPGYFAKKYQYGGIVQISMAFGQVYSSLSFFMSFYTEIAKLITVSFRLNEFVKATSKAQINKKVEQFLTENKISIKVTKDRNLALNGINLFKPDLSILLQNFSLKIIPGEKILIMGESGIGKSTLLRTIAGIWPFASGEINIPDNANFLFLPQKPYLPTGSLAKILQFPKIDQEIPSDILKNSLHKCGLSNLEQSLENIENWSAKLSLGEQQRISFARVLLHKPNWLILDEATSALDESYERQMYQLIQDEIKDISIISVGHRSSLEKLHTRIVRLS